MTMTLTREIPFKQWCMEEAERSGVQIYAIHKRFYSGKYPGLKRRHQNSRVVFVRVKKGAE